VSDNCAIRRACPDDAPLVAEVIRRSFAGPARRFGLTPENCPTHASNCTEEWVASAMADGARFYLLEQAGRACGCVALERASDDACYMERLAVLPERRRRGLGSTLVEHAMLEAQRMGVGRLEIGLIAGQTDLRRWYERRGFRVTRQGVCYDHLPFEVTFMAAELREPAADG
jgi:ribosomal protein S18 acetylase RimI-like enzyme